MEEKEVQSNFYKLNFNSRLPLYVESTNGYHSFLVQLDVAPFFLKLNKKVEVANKDGRVAIVKGELSSVEVITLAKISDKESRQQDALFLLAP